MGGFWHFKKFNLHAILSVFYHQRVPALAKALSPREAEEAIFPPDSSLISNPQS